MYIHNHFRIIFLGDMGGDLGLGGDLGTRRRGVGINMHINNLLGFIFLGGMGGTWG